MVAAPELPRTEPVLPNTLGEPEASTAKNRPLSITWFLDGIGYSVYLHPNGFQGNLCAADQLVLAHQQVVLRHITLTSKRVS